MTKRVEDAVAGVAGVKHITSTISEGTSSTTIEFRLETSSDRALNDVKDAIAKIRSDLPHTIDEPIVSRVDVAGLPIIVYGVSAPAMTPEACRGSWTTWSRANCRACGRGRQCRAARRRRPRDPRELDPDRLVALGITAADVNSQLRLTSADMAGGRGESAARSSPIRTLAGARPWTRSAPPRSCCRAAARSGWPISPDCPTPPRSRAPSPGWTASRWSASPCRVPRARATPTVAAAVAAKMTELQSKHPGVVFTADRLLASSNTVGNYDSAMHGLLEGAALAVLVVLIFLRDWRATLIAAIALPLSVLPTFWAMQAMGFSLNLVSLLAITLVTGILVDDAIVEIENIARHIKMGKTPYRASLEAADEIGLAVIAITATIVAIFSPVSFMGGIAGQYFKQFGLTIAAAVIFSLLVARLLTPLLAAYFMRPHARAEPKEGAIMRGYLRLVSASVRHKFVTLFIGLLFFAASIASVQLLPSGFLPKEDKARTQFAIELPPGAKLDETTAVTDDLTRKIRAIPEVRSVFVDGGRLLPGKLEIRLATLTVNLTPKANRTRTQEAIEIAIGSILREQPDIRFWSIRDNGQRDIALVLSGPNQAVVTATAARLQREMSTIPHLVNVLSTAPLDRTEIQVKPRSATAAELGVSTSAIAQTVRVGTIGDVGANLAKFTDGDRQVPIRVELPPSARGDIALLRTLRVPTLSGGSVPLESVADLSLSRGPTSIERYDRSVRIALEADTQGSDALGNLIAQAMALPTAKNLPPGVTLSQVGDAEIMNEVFSGFAMAMGTGLMMVLAVLILLFGSVLQPLTILFSLPLSIGGAILGLLIFQKPISMPVVIGILMLMGVVTKNAIMLVDLALDEMKEGVDRAAAIIDAGRKRARPIVMTTIAMAAGMIPSAMAFGIGGEFRSPMAIAVIGGLIVSTLLSLVFVPAIFVLMNDAQAVLARWAGRLVGGPDDDLHRAGSHHAEPPLAIAAE